MLILLQKRSNIFLNGISSYSLHRLGCRQNLLGTCGVRTLLLKVQTKFEKLHWQSDVVVYKNTPLQNPRVRFWLQIRSKIEKIRSWYMYYVRTYWHICSIIYTTVCACYNHRNKYVRWCQEVGTKPYRNGSMCSST